LKCLIKGFDKTFKLTCPCAVERDALSSRGSRLSPGASPYQRIISNNSYAHEHMIKQGVILIPVGNRKRVPRCPVNCDRCWCLD